MFRFQEGLVALNVDVDVGVDLPGDGVDSVGAAGKVGGGELERPAVGLAELGNFVGVGGDQDAVELGAGLCGLEDPGEHGSPGDGAEDFTGQAGGGEAGGDDTENGGRLLFPLRRIKYDGI